MNRMRDFATAPPSFDAAFLNDPYPVYRQLRAAGPVLWRDDVFQGAWVLTRHADVSYVQRLLRAGVGVGHSK